MASFVGNTRHPLLITFFINSAEVCVQDKVICKYRECSRSNKTFCFFYYFGKTGDVKSFAFCFRTCFAKMELVIDLKIDNKSSSYRNVITDFGYFKKITGESVRIVDSVSKENVLITPNISLIKLKAL